MNELYHYGVKGMKWGKRKKQPLVDAAGNNLTPRENAALTYELAKRGMQAGAEARYYRNEGANRSIGDGRLAYNTYARGRSRDAQMYKKATKKAAKATLKSVKRTTKDRAAQAISNAFNKSRSMSETAKKKTKYGVKAATHPRATMASKKAANRVKYAARKTARDGIIK